MLLQTCNVLADLIGTLLWHYGPDKWPHPVLDIRSCASTSHAHGRDREGHSVHEHHLITALPGCRALTYTCLQMLLWQDKRPHAGRKLIDLVHQRSPTCLCVCDRSICSRDVDNSHIRIEVKFTHAAYTVSYTHDKCYQTPANHNW